MLHLSLPAHYILELTALCNNQCVGCGNVYSHRLSSSMEVSSWKTLITSFGDQAEQITLSGGEPTLYPDFFTILRIATSYKALVNVFTNGRWHNPHEVVSQLREQPNLDGLLISLHGATSASHETFTRVKGSFTETLDNIALATSYGINVKLSTIITHQNWDEIEKIVMLTQQLGAECVTFPRYIGPTLPGIEPSPEESYAAVQQIETLIASGAPVEYGICIPQCFTQNGSKGCTAGAAYIAIDPWGNVRPCNFSPTVIGSLHEHSMHDLWHSDKMNAWRALMPVECTTCAAYSICHGGCRAVQELRPDGRDPLRDKPLTEYTPAQEIKELPSSVRPRRNFRIREEKFGYALLGQGQAVPVAPDAWEIVNACDGAMSFAELAARFGQSGLDLLGELWELGMLDAA